MNNWYVKHDPENNSEFPWFAQEDEEQAAPSYATEREAQLVVDSVNLGRRLHASRGHITEATHPELIDAVNEFLEEWH